MSNFKVDNLECNTINGVATSLLGGSSNGGSFVVTEFTADNSGTIEGSEFDSGSSITYDFTSDQGEQTVVPANAEHPGTKVLVVDGFLGGGDTPAIAGHVYEHIGTGGTNDLALMWFGTAEYWNDLGPVNGVKANGRYVRITHTAGDKVVGVQIKEIKIFNGDTELTYPTMPITTSTEYSSGFCIANVVNNDISDGTSGVDFAGESGDINLWLIFDLETVQSISKIDIMPAGPGSWSFWQAKIEVSDDNTNWTTVAENVDTPLQGEYNTITLSSQTPKVTINQESTDTNFKKVDLTSRNLDGDLIVNGETVLSGEETESLIFDKLVITEYKKENTRYGAFGFLNFYKNDTVYETSSFQASDDNNATFIIDGKQGTISTSDTFSDLSNYSIYKVIDTSMPKEYLDRRDEVCTFTLTTNETRSTTIELNDSIDVDTFTYRGDGFSDSGTKDRKSDLQFEFYENDILVFDTGKIVTIDALETKELASIETTTVTLDTDTIEVSVDGTVDSIDYQTYTGQDLDGLQLLLQAVAGEGEIQTNAINKLKGVL